MGIYSMEDGACWGILSVFKDGYLKAKGVKPEIFTILSKKLNFNPYIIGNVNSTIENADLFFHPYQSDHEFELPIHLTSSFFEDRELILATPGELYTSYEKLLLPFDDATWMLLNVTFLIAFIAIVIINRLPKFIQTRFYGRNVQTPTLNVVSTFFGFSQLKFPKENLPRFKLVLFIFFCLIFRTCYQSKMFEFLTSGLRKSPPKGIQDLLDRNYTLYSDGNDKLYEKLIEGEKSLW